MSNQKNVIALIKSISGQANILTIPRVYVSLLKSHRAALLLSQCVYWSDKTHDPDGWFHKSFSEWHEETGLNQHAIETARKTLEDCEVLQSSLRRVGPTNKNHWRVDLEMLAELITDHLAVSAKSDLAETAIRDLAENAKSSISKITLTETTGGAQKKRPPNPLFDAIVSVCQIDPTINGNGSSIGKVCSALSKANPPYTPEEVSAWGKTQAWRNTPPTIWQLQQGIGSIRGTSRPEASRFDGIAEYIREKSND